ncbi:quinol oxidase subunit 4 [Pollutibacter soli]|uniref:quinol oxidase subunit 4 n=1 Tax=Pollutibacter soli TaxID=3034157 RepID=UPI0030139A44
MKTFLKQLVVFKSLLKTFVLPLIIIGVLFSCTKNYHTSKNVPPGQAKKATGAKSAKQYAPGQRKKH